MQPTTKILALYIRAVQKLNALEGLILIININNNKPIKYKWAVVIMVSSICVQVGIAKTQTRDY